MPSARLFKGNGDEVLAVEMLFVGGLAHAAHAIEDLEGEWYSSIFPKSVHYTIKGVKEVAHDRFFSPSPAQ